ncbi:bifunctional 4-hydroxy-2-oxoglutarate aldolase/2-dehydro-3-deoxy-phosphogluconate aldolase [Methylonatrum kenyense]|uniref:bifunctional 4-hydroxy-2-oxoglutarate aldolase/2-dehydro-3-deoxy-phosphogluconate aldolase n=1 Tax=Methylonatrum kenyense TaxID=455253 RepID=UPI0020BDF9F8|nr:bifunctional 4-hydroxy-2-oxoglutarate aldolase/2-dehydro-3-deoxy-phosphogluconate aldolase [Methylonatrum kenyense]MCK8514763.1 bifunctional 4-hydroxy-2-oxoglutarate aldolase/2-dehydro-3-deoxy-phosphogluconate aldolase [Methylonatrum kenyense]
MSQGIREILAGTSVLPVLRISRLEAAVPLARALVEGGLPVMEVTLRTDIALDAMRQIVREVPEARLGVGTVVLAEQVAEAADAGAAFAVSPGLSGAVARAAERAGLPLLPGVMTPSELMHARDLGFDTLKLFPAEQAGGPEMLQALSGPFPDVRFCPTGGIGEARLGAYMSQPNVIAVGGSWFAPPDLLAAGEWDTIRRLASRACHLIPHRSR